MSARVIYLALVFIEVTTLLLLHLIHWRHLPPS